ncbi:MAG TPA: ABC transporter substrate-binding protein [Methylomirabilota bacterium]|nr:ABC transporter substrate-binding protein [Methylomirabilota bacterium]
MDMTRKEFLVAGAGAAAGLVFGLPGMRLETVRAQGKELVKVPFASTHAGSIKMMTDTVRRHRLDEKRGTLWEPANLQITALADALVLKSKPVGCLANPIVALADAKGHPLRCFEALTINHSSLLVRKDSPYTSLADLKGKKVAAVTRTSGTYQSFYTVARMLGVDPEKDFQIVFAAPEAGRRFLETREVEAFNIYEPYPTNMVSAGTTRELVRVRTEWKRLTGKDMFLLGVVAYEDWIAANRDLARGIAATVREAVSLIRSDPARTIRDNRPTQGLETEAAAKLAETRLIEMYTSEPLNGALIESAYFEIEKGAEFGLLPVKPKKDLWMVLA